MNLVPMVTTQEIAFWALAPLMVIFAIGMVISRKPVHSAFCLAGMMICLAGQYAGLDAPFLFVAQIIIYTGSIMMLFLFTMMLIGVDTTDSMVETLKAHRVAALFAGFGFLELLIFAIGGSLHGEVTGLDAANSQFGGNVQGVANLIFGRYVLAFELASALVVTGALAAMVLAHADRPLGKERQRARMERRMRDYAAAGAHPGPLPSSGTFARHNSIDYPALLPDGTVAQASISTTLNIRGMAIVEAGELHTPVVKAYREIAEVQADQAGVLPDLPDQGPQSPARGPERPSALEAGDPVGSEGGAR